MAFPSNFVWGAAAASYQIEGAVNEDGKGLSIWDMMCRQPEKVWSGNTGDGNKWAQEITVPSEPCDNCTLQVIQAMSGNTVDDVGTPSPTSTYFQCADITIVADEGALLPPPDDTDGENDQSAGCTALPGAPLGAALLILGARRRRRASVR